MKKAGSIVLMELCIAALILMLACASTVQLFVRANGMNADTAARTQAMLLAQSCAEMLASGGEAEETLLAAGFEKTQDGTYERTENPAVQVEMTMRVCVEHKESEAGTLMRAEVSALQRGEVLAQLPAVCYYNKEVIHP